VLAAGSGGRVEGKVEASETLAAKATETMAASLARTIMVCASRPDLLFHSTPLDVRRLSCACAALACATFVCAAGDGGSRSTLCSVSRAPVS
jgi:hypothetical protein